MSAEILRQAFHYLYKDELPALQELARSLPENPHVINIGAGAGTSGVAFMEARPDLHLTTIDITQESSPFGCLEGEEQELKKRGLWGDRNLQIHQDSKVVGRTWTGEKMDMVFVDGDHSYEGCKGDIEAWLPHIKAGGILAIHDFRKGDLAETEDGPHPMKWTKLSWIVYGNNTKESLG
jgi:predicted O-methyltransferase YrrM